MKDKRDTVLIVDDMEINRAILRGVLESEYKILEAENGEEAMILLEQYRSAIAVVLLDVVMPVKNGYQVLEEMGACGFLNEIPVVMVTAEGSAESEVRAFDLGASDIVMKPFEPHVVKRRVENVVELIRHKLHLEERVEEQARSLQESNEVITDALSSVIEYRSMESGQHILRIRMFTKLLLQDVAQVCQEYNLDERKMDCITRAAAMHDIGKIAIPDSILNKPGPLTKEEFEIMKTHTTKGCEMLDGLDRLNDREYLRYAYNICRYHHERWDGRGYPDGLKGDNIPICAQVVSIADVYDALTTDRVYKKAYTHEKAMNMILGGECGAFSPKLLECFKNIQDQFKALSREYADGRSPQADFGARTSLDRVEAADTAQLAQTKYFAMLRYLNAAVMEVDMDADTCRLVYQPSSDFDLLRRGGGLMDTLLTFIRDSVHPDDRDQAGEHFQEYLESFFSDGLMKRSREYRIYHCSTGDYHWFRATTLRIDLDSPRSHRALIIWRDLGTADQEAPDTERAAFAYEDLGSNIPGGLIQCRNDGKLTLTRVNDGFTAMLGYTKEDVEAQFGSSLLALVYPDDRKRMVRQIREQLGRGSIIEVEYRLVRRDGSLLWVLDKGKLVEQEGTEFLYGILVDVSQTKQDQEELRLSLERHQIIMDQTNDIIFEWDMAADRFYYSHNWAKKFGYQPGSEAERNRPASLSHIHPDDVDKFSEFLRKLSSGMPYTETEYRIAKADGRYIWCRVRATTQFDASGKPIKAVGVILDVNDEKNRAQLLQARADQDALTKLYNKSAGRQRVEQYLECRTAGSLGAMLIVDVDNFKQINDRYGHMFGDAVLTQISEQIRSLFRSGDIIARIGGDEFMVFLPDLSNRGVAVARAGRIIEMFQSIFRDKLVEECKLSCSVGISYVPDHGEYFQDLFQNSDRALYQAKSQGKNCFEVYDPQSMEQGFGDMALGSISALGARIDSDGANEVETQGLIQYAFQILYRSDNMEESISAILAMVGKQFNVSRAYIFEDSQDGKRCTNTFEWCNEGVEPQKDSLVSVDYREDVGGFYKDNFAENGIFYCQNIKTLPPEQYEFLAAQGIKSMLQCAIRDSGGTYGFVGFDENEENRLWTQEQIDALTFMSELLAVFLLKKRAQDKTEATAEGLFLALDNQNSWIYTIDLDTYEMLFLNRKTREIAPGARLGMKCYQAFFDRDAPCEACPARNIRHTVNHTMEIYNPVLKVWSSADASLIKWEGKEACLLTCHDITPYKTQTPPGQGAAE